MRFPALDWDGKLAASLLATCTVISGLIAPRATGRLHASLPIPIPIAVDARVIPGTNGAWQIR
jgi:hypothetical protein